jgi:hypothetical protein
LSLVKCKEKRIEKEVVRRRSRIIDYNRQGKRIEKGMARKISKIVVYNKHEKKYQKNKQRGEKDFTKV